jgi:hypothetical protein
MNVHDVLKREVSVTSADGNNLHTSRDFLEGCVEETDPDKNPVCSEMHQSVADVRRGLLSSALEARATR